MLFRSYNPKAFTGERHYLTVRYAMEHEIEAVSYTHLIIKAGLGTIVNKITIGNKRNNEPSEVESNEV